MLLLGGFLPASRISFGRFGAITGQLQTRFKTALPR